MFSKVYFCFTNNHLSFKFLSDFILTHGERVSQTSPLTIVWIPIINASRSSFSLTFLHSSGINNLKAIARLGKNAYLWSRNGRKGSISRMSDECLMKQETVFSFYTQYQAVMRKFTLAGKTKVCNCLTLSMLRTFVQRLFQQGLTMPTFSTIYSNVIFTSCLPLRIRHRTTGLCLYAVLKTRPLRHSYFS